MVTCGLSFQNLLNTRSLSLVASKNRICFTTSDAALSFRFSFCSNLNLLLLNLLAYNFASLQTLFFFCEFGFLNLSLGYSSCNLSTLVCRCLGFCKIRIRVGYLSLCTVLTGNSESFLLTYVNTLIRFCSLSALLSLCKVLCNLDLLCSVCSCCTDRTVTLCVCYVNTCILNSGCGGLLTDALDIVGFVSNIHQVNVNQIQSNFLQFCIYVLSSKLKECITVLVNLLDCQGRYG